MDESPRCSLKLYVYEELEANFSATLRFGRHFTPPGQQHARRNCLAASSSYAECQYDDFEMANQRVFTSEVPVYQHLIRTCTLVRDPAHADAYLVPLMHGTVQSAGWQIGHLYGNSSHNGLEQLRLKELLLGFSLPRHGSNYVWPRLRHLNASTAARHVVFWSADSDFVLTSVRNVPPALRQPIKRAVYLHLGDDHFRFCKAHVSRHASCNQAFARDVTLPYRVTQWLPFGFPAAARPKRALLAANIGAKGPHRRPLLAAIGREAARPELREHAVLLPLSTAANRSGRGGRGGELHMKGVAAAAADALESTFCLCPTGDSGGFTARLFFAVLHDCIPVRVDGWQKNLSMAGSGAAPRHLTWAYPFQMFIDWARRAPAPHARIVVEVPVRAQHALVRRLAAMPRAHVEARRAYMRRIAPLLLLEGGLGGPRRLHLPLTADGEAPPAAERGARSGLDAVVRELEVVLRSDPEQSRKLENYYVERAKRRSSWSP